MENREFGILKEILGIVNVSSNRHLILGIIDTSSYSYQLAKSFERDFPIWHLKLLINERLSFQIDSDGWYVTQPFDQQNIFIKRQLTSQLLNRGRGNFKKFKIFNPQDLQGESLRSYEIIANKFNLEKIYNQNNQSHFE
tara:strand:+ start:94 stop:510 length:417 start_codon:yes stop_codon:yes gene_type:complete